ncbi:ATP-binding cassette subfamily B protein [Kribbella sp. VKM Ac-2571]|uniref:ATP-binding cassette domain-containing protein n=1 Tax=Kribbella sp. VKM Ac-2571 TaxID=2512222 RepID=UPI0010E2FF09|nr:ABC transporter ATP-binding protein [Kribbella sp. VKM Ac-2571]TDO60911.1 ATP-binding cassette subfamily B protein [Kribbella sp. VKM Ac-2571]
MLDAFRTARESLTDAIRITPGWLTTYSVLQLLLAILPGAQVVLIRELVDSGDVWRPLLGLTVVVGSMYPLTQVSNGVGQRMMLRLRLELRIELARVAARLSPSRLAEPATVRDLEASQTATHQMSDVAGKPVQLLSAAVTSLVLCVAIASINLVSGLLVLAALAPTVLAFTLISRMEAQGWPRVAEHERRAAYATEQLIQQRPGTELAVLGSGWKVADLIAGSRAKATWVLDRMIRTALLYELGAALVTVLLFGGALVALVRGGATGGAAAAAVAGTITGLNAIRQCGYAFGSIVTAAPQAAIYRRFVRSVPAGPRRAVVRQVDSVALDNVTFGYPGAAEPTLCTVSIEARRGEMIALVGVNGAGKSTAINLLVGALTPDSGRVLIDGADAGALAEDERLAHFGLLVQEFGRFEFALRDAVGLGAPDVVTDQAIRDALAGTFAADLPLDTQLGQQWGGTGISGGQWQRLALARIRLRDAGVWILDEPTSAIDAEAEHEIFTDLRRTSADRITIVVSHRAWTLREMDRIYVMDNGTVAQQGTYDELMNDPTTRFARLFATQDLTHTR